MAHSIRVAYLLVWPHGRDSGVFKKIADQVAAWEAMGATAGIFVLTDSRVAHEWRALPQTVTALERGSGVATIAARRRVVNALLAWLPDVVYHRYAMPDLSTLAMARRVPTIIEINTDDVAEYPLVAPRRARANRLIRGQLLRRAAGHVYVSRELCDRPSFHRFGRPSLVLGNGIDLAAVAPAPAPVNAAPRLVFVGAPRLPWHGLDELIALAAAKPKWRFDVIGPGPAEAPNAPENVVWYGLLTAEAYRHVVASADVGVGTLALYRKRMHEASPLKVREYLALGLPSIIGFDDTDFPGDAPFLLRVPNEPRALLHALPTVEEFVHSWIGRRVDRSAVAHLDSRVKERLRLEYMQSVARGRSGRLTRAITSPNTGSR